MLELHFKVGPANFARVLRSRLTSNLHSETQSDIKLESSQAYFLKLVKLLSKSFEIVDIFCKNAVLNICGYLKPICTYKKINNIFLLKFDHCVLRMPKNHRNRLNISCRKTRFKNITDAHVNRFRPP